MVDMSEVSFVASIGMRTLLSSAKALAKKGGKMVLLNPVGPVWDSLSTAGIDALVPIHADRDAAIADLRAALGG
jgi:anti-anti-sigma factor